MNLVLTAGAFIIGFILVTISIPPIIKIAKAKHLFEPFETRKVHTKVIPPMGGVALFIGFTLSSIVATDGISFDALKYIVASVIIIFLIGLRDDLMIVPAQKKLVVQVFAAIILITLGNVRFTNIHGVLGEGEISYITSLILSGFAMIVIINAFNLIDGIHGLFSGIAITAASIFGTWFYLAGQIQFAILSFALVGSLTGFFIFNVFGKRNKIILGDSGSLIIGLVISALVVKFNEFNIGQDVLFAVKAAPSVSFAIIAVPLVDTLRVMTIRILNKKSPFLPDNNHIHHRLLELIPSHLKVTTIIIVSNILIVGFALFLNMLDFNVNYQFLLVLFVGVILSLIPSIIIKYKTQSSLKQEKLIG